MSLFLVYLSLVSAAIKFCTQRAALRIGTLGLLTAFRGLVFVSEVLQQTATIPRQKKLTDAMARMGSAATWKR